MLGTIYNAAAILLGTLLGVTIGRRLPYKVKDMVSQSISLIVVLIGLQMAITASNIIMIMISLVIGSMIGQALEIEERFARIIDRMTKKILPQGNLQEGFITATLIFCVGPMAVTGALTSGLLGNHEVLITKSILDGTTSAVLASGVGAGVGLAAIPVFLYQGTITLMANFMQEVLSQSLIQELTATGGLLITGIGLNLLGVTRLPVGNMLPALVIIVLLLLI